MECPDWERGPGASLRCGLDALGRDIEAAVVVLADGPDLSPQAVARVVERLARLRRGGRRRQLRRRPRAPGRARPPGLGDGARRGRASADPAARALRRPRASRRRRFRRWRKGGPPTRPNRPPARWKPHALDAGRSALAQFRVGRQLPSARPRRGAGLTEDEVTWLEEGRVYRFRTPDDAMLALLLYATALGIDHREARGLAGLPVPPKPLETNPRARLIVLGAVAAALAALVAAVVLPGRASDRVRPHRRRSPLRKRGFPAVGDPRRRPQRQRRHQLDAPRRDAHRRARLPGHASRRADRFDYPQTAVYYEPGGTALAAAARRQLGIVTKPLPGGDDAEGSS